MAKGITTLAVLQTISMVIAPAVLTVKRIPRRKKHVSTPKNTRGQTLRALPAKKNAPIKEKKKRIMNTSVPKKASPKHMPRLYKLPPVNAAERLAFKNMRVKTLSCPESRKLQKDSQKNKSLARKQERATSNQHTDVIVFTKRRKIRVPIKRLPVVQLKAY